MGPRDSHIYCWQVAGLPCGQDVPKRKENVLIFLSLKIKNIHSERASFIPSKMSSENFFFLALVQKKTLGGGEESFSLPTFVNIFVSSYIYQQSLLCVKIILF